MGIPNKRTIHIPWNELVDIEYHLLNSLPWEDKSGTAVYTYTTSFGKMSHRGQRLAREVDIKVVTADPPYIDAVLFEAGCEVYCLEPLDDTILGRYSFEDHGVGFLVTVKPEGYTVDSTTRTIGPEAAGEERL